MDWIGDKLSMLIQEGKKALNREVVVMSDAKEDEVDDGSGAWEEEAKLLNPHPTSISRSSSLKRTRKPRSIVPPPAPPPSYITHLSTGTSDLPIPTSSSLPVPSLMPTTPRRTHSRGTSAETSIDPNLTFWEDERGWESPELRESMERARARFYRGRGT